MVTLSSSLRQSLIYATLQKRIDRSKEENARDYLVCITTYKLRLVTNSEKE